MTVDNYFSIKCGISFLSILSFSSFVDVVIKKKAWYHYHRSVKEEINFSFSFKSVLATNDFGKTFCICAKRYIERYDL